ncbi:protein YgfX [Massilia sp. W12]|uniref:protein YgfX n=1 Tax=Massilia sp. W12 TaxID=3126507 RepID=UPI0030CBC383
MLIELRPRRILLLLRLALSLPPAIAALLLLRMELTPLWRWLGPSLCACLFLMQCWPFAQERRRYRLQLANGILSLCWAGADLQWNQPQEAQLQRGSFFWPGLLWLRLRTADRRMHHLPVSCYCLSQPEFRQLARHLRALDA